MTSGKKFRSTVDTGVGDGVACAAGLFSTRKEFSAVDPEYALEPAKLTKT